MAAARAEAAAEAAAAARAAAGVVDVEAAADYSSLRVPELQAELRRRSLSPTGRKAELLDRLRQADAATAAPAAPASAARPAQAGAVQQPSRHMLLPSDGAAHLCDDEGAAPRPPPAADAAADAAASDGGDEGRDEGGDWAEPPGAVPPGDDCTLRTRCSWPRAGSTLTRASRA